MVWTEVSGLLAVVAALVVVVSLIAIVFQETRRKPVLQRMGQRRLPDNADLSEGERRDAMHHYCARR